MSDYLQQLTVRLAAGLANVDESRRQTHLDYLLACQRSDGGFAGREGESDLYYTAFGLRALAILGELYDEPAERASRFLRGRLTGRESIVDFFSLIYAATLLRVSAGIDIFDETSVDWRDAVSDALAKLRRSDGGYAKGIEGHASSTYHTFLVILCLEMIERPIPQAEEIVSFVRSQVCDDGGFREIVASKRAGTNPTAAAIATLNILNALDEDTIDGAIDFVCEMQNEEGGLCANTRIPAADVLSSFTGMVTLRDLGALQEINIDAMRSFVARMEQPDGGFHAFSLDQNHDVEYTFYGIGALALLHSDDLTTDDADGETKD